MKLTQSVLLNTFLKCCMENHARVSFDRQTARATPVKPDQIASLPIVSHSNVKRGGSLRYNTKGGFPRNMVRMSLNPRRVKPLTSVSQPGNTSKKVNKGNNASFPSSGFSYSAQIFLRHFFMNWKRKSKVLHSLKPSKCLEIQSHILSQLFQLNNI